MVGWWRFETFDWRFMWRKNDSTTVLLYVWKYGMVLSGCEGNKSFCNVNHTSRLKDFILIPGKECEEKKSFCHANQASWLKDLIQIPVKGKRSFWHTSSVTPCTLCSYYSMKKKQRTDLTTSKRYYVHRNSVWTHTKERCVWLFHDSK